MIDVKMSKLDYAKYLNNKIEESCKGMNCWECEYGISDFKLCKTIKMIDLIKKDE